MCIGGMEESHVITTTVATLTQVSYLYPEINEHEYILDADLNNTILLCSAFHAVPWFYIVQHNENTNKTVCIGCPVRKHS